MMELFTLGAGRGYTEQDVREQARALTGLARATGSDSDGPTNFRYDPSRHDAGVEDGLRQARRLRRGATPASSALSIPTTRRSSSRSCGATSSRRRRQRATRRALEALYARAATRCGPSSRRSSGTRRSTRARGWSSRRSSTPPGSCARSVAASTRDAGPGSREGAGQRLFYPPNVAGWDDTRWLDTSTFRGRWAIANEALEASRSSRRSASRRRRRATRTRRRRARSLLGQPERSAARRSRAPRFARGALRGATRWKAEPTRCSSRTPSASCSRCRPTSRRLTWPAPATTSRARSSCDAASPGRQRPAGDRARDADAGGHRPRPAHLPRARLGARARGLRRRALRLERLRGGHCAAALRPTRAACSSRSSSTAAPTRSRCSSRPPTRSTAQLRPTARARRRRRDRRSPRTAGLQLAPVARPARAAPRRGQGQRDPGDRLRPPEPVALHVAPLLGGRRDRRAARAPAGSAAISTASGRPTTRCRACRSTGASSPRSRPAKVPVAADRRARPTTTSGRAASGATVETRMLDAIGGSAPPDARRRRRSRRRPRCGPPVGAACTEQLGAVRPKGGASRSRARSPTRRRRRFPRRLAGLAAMLAAGLPLRCVALSALRATTTRTTTRPSELATA